MTNWEKELENIRNAVFFVADKDVDVVFYMKKIEASIAKQRTQIFKEVREKVIGNDSWFYEYISGNSGLEDSERKIRNEHRNKQLKKLKELEEGK